MSDVSAGRHVFSRSCNLGAVAARPPLDSADSRISWLHARAKSRSCCAAQPLAAGPYNGRLALPSVNRRLVDELWLKIHPIVLGKGKRLFGETSDEKILRLLNNRTIDGDIVLKARGLANQRGINIEHAA